ncbi:MAG: hypothetical protein HY043_10150 [Verrucomicrobia bacterium]|nr:hypothetical protein [Verrucomicrobiota bacterium]
MATRIAVHRSPKFFHNIMFLAALQQRQIILTTVELSTWNAKQFRVAFTRTGPPASGNKTFGADRGSLPVAIAFERTVKLGDFDPKIRRETADFDPRLQFDSNQ